MTSGNELGAMARPLILLYPGREAGDESVGGNGGALPLGRTFYPGPGIHHIGTHSVEGELVPLGQPPESVFDVVVTLLGGEVRGDELGGPVERGVEDGPVEGQVGTFG